MSEQLGFYWHKIDELMRRPSSEKLVAVETNPMPQASRSEADYTRATALVVRIYEDIKAHSPEVLRAPMSQIRNDRWLSSSFYRLFRAEEVEEVEESHIALRWGLWRTPEERARDNELWSESVGKSLEDLPDELKEDKVLTDLRFIYTRVRSDQLAVCTVNPYAAEAWTDPYEYTFDEVFPIDDFLENPEIILPSVAKSLNEPHHFVAIRPGKKY